MWTNVSPWLVAAMSRAAAAEHGMAVKVDPMKLTLKAPRTKRLKG